MCKWNKNCEYKSDERCHECDYNYIKTNEELRDYLEFEKAINIKENIDIFNY